MFIEFFNCFLMLIEVSIACPSNAVYVGSKCYWVTTTAEVASDGDVLCRNDGGELALIPDQQTTDVINLYRDGLGHSTTEYYLGYYDNADGSYVDAWTGGIQTWTNWWDEQPNSELQDCVTIWGSEGKWFDESCDQTYYALCCNDSTIHTESTTTTTEMSTDIHSTTLVATDTTQTSEPTTDVTTGYTQHTTKIITTSEDGTQSPTTTNSEMTNVDTQSSPSLTTSVNIQSSLSLMKTTTVGTQTVTCSCECEQTPTITITANMTEAIQELVEKIKKELTVDTTTLSSSVRKKTSADDSRPSAAAVGSLGIVLLTVIFGGLILQDLPMIFVILKKRLLNLFKKFC